MKKMISMMAVAACASLAITSCNNQPQQNETKGGNATEQKSGSKIAFVEVDSIMSQYDFWKDVTKLMEQKERNIQGTLAAKQKNLQQAAQNFQQGIQSNKYTQQQAQSIQASLQKQAQDADALQQRLGAEYQQEVAKYNKALTDSIHHFIDAFNKDKKYSMILAKQGDNILYADKSLDITDEIVKGMNKAYKGMKAEK
jgi:outer membrane protein